MFTSKMFSLKANRHSDRRREQPRVGVDEVSMSHPKETSDVGRRAPGDDPWTSANTPRDWDVDTNVMPPEYCRQLLEISRQLQRGK
jgi:hypothetical protein